VEGGIEERILKCLAPGVSVIVGSVSAEGVPACCRAAAMRSTDNLKTATIFVPVATSKETMANVAATRRLAVVSTYPIEHLATQLKGTVRGSRHASEDEREFVKAYLNSFMAVLQQLGYPARATNAFNYWPAHAIEMDVEQIFDQSPGPRAGARLR
jgi:hypothetical protein